MIGAAAAFKCGKCHETAAAERRNNLSPGLQPWVKWKT
jgi:hypothetical protein